MSSAIDILEPRPQPKRSRKRRRFLLGRQAEAAGQVSTEIETVPESLPRRPRVREECKDGPRPCPWVGCRYHLYLDIYTTGDPENPTPGLIIHHPDVDPMDLPETCLLDVAEKGPFTLAEIGDLFGLSRERIRQIEASALRKLSSGNLARDSEALRKILDACDRLP